MTIVRVTLIEDKLLISLFFKQNKTISVLHFVLGLFIFSMMVNIGIGNININGARLCSKENFFFPFV